MWLYFRFPLSFRMVEDMLAYRGIIVAHKTLREWAEKFEQTYSSTVRRRIPALMTLGVCMSLSSPSKVKATGYGAPLIRMVLYSMLLIKVAETPELPAFHAQTPWSPINLDPMVLQEESLN